MIHALTDLKSSEIILRENLNQKKTPTFKEDLEWAYQFVKARRQLVERHNGIRR